MGERIIRFRVNGRPVEVTISDNMLLLNVLRDRLGLTGTKYACGIGECGACTVLIDGEPALSCLVLAADVEGKEVTTIEGIDNGFQEEMVKNSGVQCGYCTPGFVVLSEFMPRYFSDREPTEDDVRKYFTGNVCRCTGYLPIVKSGLNFMRKLRSRRE